MNDTLRPLPNGDFEVLKEGSKELEMYLAKKFGTAPRSLSGS